MKDSAFTKDAGYVLLAVPLFTAPVPQIQRIKGAPSYPVVIGERM